MVSATGPKIAKHNKARRATHYTKLQGASLRTGLFLANPKVPWRMSSIWG